MVNLYYIYVDPLHPILFLFFFFSSRRRHTRSLCDWSSDVCSSDLKIRASISDILPVDGANFVDWTAGTVSFTVTEIGRASCRGKSVDLGGRRIIKKKKKKMN